MKKYILKTSLFITFFVASSFAFISKALAAEKIPNPIGVDNIGGLISKASSITTPLAIVGLIATVIYGGYTRMTAMGNADKEQKSSAILVAAFIGFAIIAFAPLLIKIIGNLLGISTQVIN